METFFEYWKRGWKVFLMMFCVNLSFLLLFVPIAIISLPLGGKGTYYILSIIFGIIFIPVFAYWVFKFFYGEQ